MRIGVDLDNTIIDYEDAFRIVAAERGLLPAGFRGGKRAVQKAMRVHDAAAWRDLQLRVYTDGLQHARLADGCADFWRHARATPGVSLFVVSHKTEELRPAARAWLATQPLALAPGELFFEPTSAEKVKRIRALRCDVFIDDLPDILSAPGFPPNTRGMQYFPGTWARIEHDLLGADRGRRE
jgi:hypothetical protein